MYVLFWARVSHLFIIFFLQKKNPIHNCTELSCVNECETRAFGCTHAYNFFYKTHFIHICTNLSCINERETFVFVQNTSCLFFYKKMLFMNEMCFVKYILHAYSPKICIYFCKTLSFISAHITVHLCYYKHTSFINGICSANKYINLHICQNLHVFWHRICKWDVLCKNTHMCSFIKTYMHFNRIYLIRK